jgi:hypothetical protein
LAAAYREVAVHGDSNEYGTISAEELKAADTDFRNAKFSPAELEKIKLNYLGKWLQTGIFRNCIPRKAHQEYLEQYQGTKIYVISKNVFVYPEA